MENSPIVTFDLYLAMGGMFAMIMVGRSLVQALRRTRRPRVVIRDPNRLERRG